MKVAFVIGDLRIYSPGGAEHHAYDLARELTARDVDVEFVLNQRNEDNRPIESWVKFVHVSKSRDISKACEEVNADIYYQISSDAFTGAVAVLAKRSGKLFVFRASSIDDCGLSMKGPLWSKRDWAVRFLIYLGITAADAIIVQSEQMRQELAIYFSDKAINVIPPGQQRRSPTYGIGTDGNPYVLWASNMREYKEPELVLSLAKSLPNVDFVMVGGGSLFSEIERLRMKWKLKNVTLTGEISDDDDMNRLYSEATLALDTSVSHGSSNVGHGIIRAWWYGLPVVTYGFDPGEIVCRRQFWFHVNSLEEASERIRLLVNDEKLRSEIGHRAYDYVSTNYRIEADADSHIAFFNELLACHSN